MTIDQLKANRVILTTGYPGSNFSKGDIFIESPLGYYFKEGVLTTPLSVIETKDIEAYPKLFSKINWTIGRKDEDYPEYIEVYIRGYEGAYKVDGWQRSYPDGDLWTLVERNNHATRVFANQTNPLSEEDFNQRENPSRSVATDDAKNS